MRNPGAKLVLVMGGTGTITLSVLLLLGTIYDPANTAPRDFYPGFGIFVSLLLLGIGLMVLPKKG